MRFKALGFDFLVPGCVCVCAKGLGLKALRFRKELGARVLRCRVLDFGVQVLFFGWGLQDKVRGSQLRGTMVENAWVLK